MSDRLSAFCNEWLRLYRIWEASDEMDDWIALRQHQVECEKCRKPKEEKQNDKSN